MSHPLSDLSSIFQGRKGKLEVVAVLDELQGDDPVNNDEPIVLSPPPQPVPQPSPSPETEQQPVITSPPPPPAPQPELRDRRRRQ